eukprot:3559896-Prymnesium_polylepis.1
MLVPRRACGVCSNSTPYSMTDAPPHTENLSQHMAAACRRMVRRRAARPSPWTLAVAARACLLYTSPSPRDAHES